NDFDAKLDEGTSQAPISCSRRRFVDRFLHYDRLAVDDPPETLQLGADEKRHGRLPSIQALSYIVPEQDDVHVIGAIRHVELELEAAAQPVACFELVRLVAEPLG